MSQKDLNLALKIDTQVKSLGDLNEMIDTLEGAGQNVDRLRLRSEGLAKEWDRLNPEEQAGRIEQIRKAALKASEGTDALSNSTNRLAKTTSKARVYVKALIASLGGFAVFRTAKSYIENLVGTGARFEQLRAQLTALTGSAENADKSLAWIKEFAKNTPSDIESVTSSFVNMKAFGLDPMDGSFQALIDQTAKLGFSQEKLDGIVLAVGQAWTKQKLQGEEALQLIERGVPVWDLLAKATDKNVVELQKLSSAGQLGRQEIRLLIEEMGRSSQGAAKAQMSTWNGLVSNLKDVWLDFQNTVAESGALDYFKQQLDDLLAKTKAMAADGSLKRYAGQVSDSIIRASESVKSFIQTLINLAPIIKSTALALVTLKFAQLASSVVSASVAIKGKFIGALTATTTAAAQSTARAEMLSAAIKGVGAALSFLKVNPVVALATTLGTGLFAAINALIPKTHEWRKSVDKAFNSLVDLQTRAAKGIEIKTNDLAPLKEQMAEIDRQISELVNKDTGIMDFAKDAIPWLDSNNQQLMMLVQRKDELTARERELHAQIKDNEQAETQGLEKAKAYAEQQKQVDKENIALLEKRNAELEKLGDTESDYYQYVVSELHTLNKTLDETATKNREAFEAVGLSFDEIATGMTAVETKITSSLQTGVEQIKAMGGTAEETSQRIKRYLGAAFDTLKTPEGITAAIAELEKLENKTPETVSTLDALKRKLAETSPAFKELANSIAKATSVEQIEAFKVAAKSAFDKKEIGLDEYNLAMKDAANATKKVNEETTQSTKKATTANKESTKATKEDTDAKKENAEANKAVSGSAGGLIQDYLEVKNSFVASEKAVKHFDDALRKATETTMMSPDHFAKEMQRASDSALVVYKEWQDETQRSEQYIASLNERVAEGKIGIDDMALGANAAEMSFSKLNDAQLSKIQGEIDKARQKVVALDDQAKKTAQSIADELANETGSEEDKINLEYKRRIEKVREQDGGTGRTGNAVANLEKLRQIKLNELREREAEQVERERERQANAAKQTQRRGATTTQSQPFDTDKLIKTIEAHQSQKEKSIAHQPAIKVTQAFLKKIDEVEKRAIKGSVEEIMNQLNKHMNGQNRR